jgi:tRNA(Ile)-lysidine synthase
MDIHTAFMKMQSVRDLIVHPGSIAVAVSGGPDSMALLSLLSTHLSQYPDAKIHALTFDHGLRDESRVEAQQVGEWVANWSNVEHHILNWHGDKPDTSIMEQARDARYTAMCAWCHANAIKTLWLGHHQTDQAETFLFRLAKGSGLDGLGGMGEYQPCSVDPSIMLVRPMLQMAKADIVAFCHDRAIPHVTDPSNINMKYARARLRHALPALEAEGLTESRLAATSRRLERARVALDHYADQIIAVSAQIETTRSTVALDALNAAPDEIRIRVIRRVLDRMGPGGYGPRLDRLEDIIDQIFNGGGKRFTLGGYVFAREGDVFSIQEETF